MLKRLFQIGGYAAILVILCNVLDIAVGSILGGDLTALPRTAAERFAQLEARPLLGLYNLDLLNALVQLAVLPAYAAIYAATRAERPASASIGLLLFAVATPVFLSANAALPMLDLAGKYAGTSAEAARSSFAAAGEALLSRGAHGSAGAFAGFFLSILAAIALSCSMLGGRPFPRTAAYAGIAGNALLLAYLVLVTFVPAAKPAAMAIALPGGLVAMAWLALVARGLLKAARS
jgi:hypothetical protein